MQKWSTGERGGGRKKRESKGGKSSGERRWRGKTENAPVTLPSWKVPQGKNVTKPKKSEYVWRVGAKKKKKEKKILNFQPTAWERSVFLPVRQAPWNEKAKQTCSPRLYLVNHQHYKPVLQALWGRKEEERERKKERVKQRLARKIQAGGNKPWKKQYLIKVEHVVCHFSNV